MIGALHGMLAALLWATPAAPAGPSRPAADSFPHAAHRRLFTSCQSCHAGIASGDSVMARPVTPACASCHDGRTSRMVDWAPRGPRPSNLRFDHRRHFAAAPDSAANATSCQGCHASSTGSAFMDVARATPQRCLNCHAHRAVTHFAAETRCSVCHLPLVEATRLTAATIARFPKPATHDSGFTFAHADAAQQATACQVCHTRESCATCHVNAARLAPIQLLGSDRRVAQLVRDRPVTYRAPSSHAASDFTRGHGLLARAGAQACANCHARESCLICHSRSPRVPIVATLPRAGRDGAAGVQLAMMRPPGHGPGFRAEHRTAAAGGDASCSRCHSQTYCAACHDGARSGFHPANFVSRHAPAAIAPASECSSCHQVQVFCRDCHRQTRLAPTAVSGSPGRFHNAQPAWSFGHGGAARRSLESCAACHQQSFCLPCHSASQGWKVNPHGPGFKPAMGDRNPAMCRTCHTQGPPGG